jgi:FAD/FMN-containing dehydrogenase
MPKRAFFVPMDTWVGRHRTYRQSIEGQHDFKVSAPLTSATARLQAYNDITQELQEIIGQAVQNGKTLRAFGSSWSLSPVAVTEHELINTKPLRIAFTIPKSQVAPAYAGDSDRLRFLECGFSIAEINNLLFRDRLSLKASGSNNGQTLSGAISTNTHGSAFRFGATPDFVVGIHLVTGPSSHVYLERTSAPVVQESFADMLGASLIRDDTLFNAALVSFGSFGVIHGLMIEARELFLLHAFRSFRPLDDALRSAISTLDFSGLDLHGQPESALYHFQVTVNPNAGTPPPDVAVYLMFEEPWTDHYEPPPWDETSAGPGASGLEIVGALYDRLPRRLGKALRSLLNEQVRNHLAPYEVTAPLMDLFGGEHTQGPVFASGIGLPAPRAVEALTLALDVYAEMDTVLPVLLTMRFLKGTRALLGFTRFDPTCVLEIDGLNNRKTHEYAGRVWAAIEQADIPLTMHWGKFNTFLTEPRVRRMYGEGAARWIASRETLLSSPAVRQVFSNDFLRSVGLAT